MKTSLLIALTFVTSIIITAFPTTTFAQAQQQQAQSQPGEKQEASPSDKAAFLNARIAALKAVLALTPDQEKLWMPVETAFRDAVKESGERGSKLRNRSEPTNVLELLAVVADHEVERAQALKKFVTALQPLAASLTPEQKRRIPAFLGRVVPGQRGPSSVDLWIFEEED
jgi:LTXXQ motif family protein